jgi:hypothetical protein
MDTYIRKNGMEYRFEIFVNQKIIPKFREKPKDFRLAPIERSILPIFYRERRDDSGNID